MFAIAALSILVAGLAPHVVYRFPLALLAAVALWRRWRWGFAVAMIAAVVWILDALTMVPFLLVAPPWLLWFQWLYWWIPTALVIWAACLLLSRAGKEERHRMLPPANSASSSGGADR